MEREWLWISIGDAVIGQRRVQCDITLAWWLLGSAPLSPCSWCSWPERDEWVSELITEWINQWMVVTVSFDKVPRPSVKPNQSPWAHTLCSVHVHVLCLLQHSPLFKAFLAAFHMISLFPLSFFLEAHISCCQQTDTLQVCTFPGSYMEKKQTLVVSCNKLTTIRIFSGGRTLKKKN